MFLQPLSIFLKTVYLLDYRLSSWPLSILMTTVFPWQLPILDNCLLSWQLSFFWQLSICLTTVFLPVNCLSTCQLSIFLTTVYLLDNCLFSDNCLSSWLLSIFLTTVYLLFECHSILSPSLSRSGLLISFLYIACITECYSTVHTLRAYQPRPTLFW